jgi:hypothetical protein
MALEDSTLKMAEESAAVSNALEDQGDLVVVEGRLGAIQKDAAMRAILDLGIAAGRAQTARVFSQMADVIQVSQLRRIKEMAKAAGIPWAQACNLAGFSSKTADQYLRIANDLGDDFMADVSRLGVSIRTLEAARQLPEPVRQALAQGEVVDLEAVSKEALTDVIKQLAADHAKENAAAQEALEKETKRAARADDQYIKAKAEAADLAQELEAQKLGLPAEDAAALELILTEERKIIPWLVRVKNTTYLEGRDPHFVARLVNHLNLIGELALATGHVLSSLAAGDEPNEELINHGARLANRDCATFDQRDPYPGI